jgi:hypothetical protein
VQLLNSAMMTLASVDDASLLRGRQYGAGRQWRGDPVRCRDPDRAGYMALTRLLRGRRGTEWAMTGHAASEPFLLLDQTSLLAIPSSYACDGFDAADGRHRYRDTTPATASALVAGQAVLPLSPGACAGHPAVAATGSSAGYAAAASAGNGSMASMRRSARRRKAIAST